jgi:putative two-component system response regulator
MDKATILIVEDNIVNIKIVESILKDYCKKLYTAKNGNEAINIIETVHIDMILLDVGLPDISGFDVAKSIRSDSFHNNIPIIFLTSDISSDSIEMAFEVGGVDYISKPFNSRELIARVQNHLRLKYANDRLVDYKDDLEIEMHTAIKEIKTLNKELEATQKEVIFTMGSIAETRSKETGNHVKRVAEYSYILAKLCGLDENEAILIREASPMHDVGKVGIPDAILNKPAPLSEDEFRIMKTHSKLGYNMLKHSERPILKAASIIAYQHHEKYDGTGYPKKLKANEIHIYGRITAIADVFDALGSDRCYKKAWELDKVIDFFIKQKGKHFDPKMVELFLSNLDKFLEVRDRFKDRV